MWDEEDGFYYDVLRLPDGQAERLKVRSIVGLLPICATTVVEPWQRERVPRRGRALRAAAAAHAGAARGIHPTGEGHSGTAAAASSAVVSCDRLRRVLERMLDEQRVPQPVRHPRALARRTRPTRSSFGVHGEEYRVDVPASGIDSGHVRRQLELARADLDAGERAADPCAAAVLLRTTATTFTVECPTGSGSTMNLFEVADEITARLSSIFLRDEHGRRPVYGGDGQLPERSALARSPAVLRILPRRQRRGPRREPPDRMERARRDVHRIVRPRYGRRVPRGREVMSTVAFGGGFSNREGGQWTRQPA